MAILLFLLRLIGWVLLAALLLLLVALLLSLIHISEPTRP